MPLARDGKNEETNRTHSTHTTRKKMQRKYYIKNIIYWNLMFFTTLFHFLPFIPYRFMCFVHLLSHRKKLKWLYVWVSGVWSVYAKRIFLLPFYLFILTAPCYCCCCCFSCVCSSSFHFLHRYYTRYIPKIGRKKGARVCDVVFVVCYCLHNCVRWKYMYTIIVLPI